MSTRHIYRRPRSWGYNRWHFCRNCRSWPRQTYEEMRREPPSYDVCGECKRLSDWGECRSGISWL